MLVMSLPMSLVCPYLLLVKPKKVPLAELVFGFSGGKLRIPNSSPFISLHQNPCCFFAAGPMNIPDPNVSHGPFLVGGLKVSTHLKNISQIGSFPQIGVKIKNI